MSGPRLGLRRDTSRIEQLIHANATDLYDYFARRVTPVEDAADLLSDTLLVAWRRNTSIPTDDREARMWLFGVARQTLNNHRRGRRRHVALADKLRNEVIVAQATALASSDMESDIRHQIAALPANQSELIMLVHGEGFTIAEAARILGTNPSTARSRYARARASLQMARDTALPSIAAPEEISSAT